MRAGKIARLRVRKIHAEMCDLVPIGPSGQPRGCKPRSREAVQTMRLSLVGSRLSRTIGPNQEKRAAKGKSGDSSGLALPLALKSILDKQFLAVHTEPHETAESDQTHAVEA